MKTVYLVEDEIIIAMMNRTILQKNGFIVIGICYSKKDLLSIFDAKPADIVFMDIALEDSSAGIDAAREIKAKHPAVKIYFVSAYPYSTYQTQLKDLDYESYIDKLFFEKAVKHLKKGA